MAVAERVGLVGRRHELERALDVVRDHAAGPRSLLIDGEAGIGKTAIWEEVVAGAERAGYRILVCRCVESEAQLSFMALGDLLEGVHIPQELPPPQRHALEVALLRSDPDEQEAGWRAVAMGFLATVRHLAAEGPVLLAIDDVQWLDTATARVLGSALRRLESGSVLIAVTERSATPGPLDLEHALPGVVGLRVPGLDASAMADLLQDRLDRRFDPSTVTRLVEATGGNPFLALELARYLAERGDEPGAPFPVPDDVRDLLVERLSSLSDGTLQVLAAAAASPRRTVETIREAVGRDVAADLEEARDGGIVELRHGSVAFTHPLVAATLVGLTSVEQRRPLHGRLAEIASDPEQRARHLALATVGSDAAVADQLQEGADHASRRGAPDVAAELTEIARDRTPRDDHDTLVRRALSAIDRRYLAGDAARCRELLQRMLEEVDDGPARGHALLRLGRYIEHDLERSSELFRRALTMAGDDRHLVGSLHAALALAQYRAGDAAGAFEDAETALTVARDVEDGRLLTQARMAVGFIGAGVLGVEGTEELLWDAARDEDASSVTSVYDTARTTLGLRYLWTDRLDAARELLEQQAATAADRGDENSHAGLLLHLAELDVRQGRFAEACLRARDAHQLYLRIGEHAGSAGLLYVRALTDAHAGLLDSAREFATEALAVARGNSDVVFELQARRVLGFVALSAGDVATAADRLRDVPDAVYASGIGEPGLYQVDGDAVEALVRNGETDEARRILDRLQDAADRSGRAWARMVGARAEGLLAAAAGDLDRALAHLECALEHDPGYPFERARTLLAVGGVHRRDRRKNAAREALEASLALFERTGAEAWVAIAQEELGRVGGRTQRHDELTSTERAIAVQAAEGLTNREIAEKVFLSVKTVESTLTRVYRKLGLRSRTELANHLREGS